MLLKQVFDAYDEDGSGSLERSELLQALQEQKASVTRVKCGKKTLEERQAEKGLVKGQAPGARGIFLVDFADSLFRVLDANNDQRIEFLELLRLLYPLATEAEMSTMLHWVKKETPEPEEDEDELTDEQRNEIHSMFRIYDKDRSGTITPAEFRLAMRRCGLSAEEMDEIFAEADIDESGGIDIEEFTAMMWSTMSSEAKLTHSTLYDAR